ncbi:MAG: hypothetical protein Unbinned92contig1002_36 [Prokaryotic dsDNA virus sp.]|nr:MAG: hypothetical protein Unbinned92contig1002_36 [Prokaryotic dsDNA virus sp.]|tara:strand:- start:4106 stop:4372 length:267 start_codon:yes stop_codon:yes gene_type:complete
MIKVGKYEFATKQKFEDALVDVSNKHNVVVLGNIDLGTKLSDKFHVDVLWAFDDEDESHPESFADKIVNLENDGVHAFLGVDYLTHKI